MFSKIRDFIDNFCQQLKECPIHVRIFAHLFMGGEVCMFLLFIVALCVGFFQATILMLLMMVSGFMVIRNIVIFYNRRK